MPRFSNYILLLLSLRISDIALNAAIAALRITISAVSKPSSKKVKYMHIALLLSAYYTYTLTFYSTGFHLGFISKHFSLKKCLILLHISWAILLFPSRNIWVLAMKQNISSAASKRFFICCSSLFMITVSWGISGAHEVPPMATGTVPYWVH